MRRGNRRKVSFKLGYRSLRAVGVLWFVAVVVAVVWSIVGARMR